MKAATKVRWLLFIITIGIIATTLTARWANRNLYDLKNKAQVINSELSDRESIIENFIKKQRNLDRLGKATSDGTLAEKFLRYFRDRKIHYQIIHNNELKLWSDASIISRNIKSLDEGSNFAKYTNGWYEVIKKNHQNYTFIFFIPIKPNIIYKNKYLVDNSHNFVIDDESVEIANPIDSKVISIRNLQGSYLFSVKKGSQKLSKSYIDIEVILWIMALVSLLLLVNSICKYYADKGYPLTASIFLLAFLALLRYLGLKYHFPEPIYQTDLFNPTIFGSNSIFPSFADLCINNLALLFFMIFIYSYRHKIFKPITNKWIGYSLLAYGFVLFVLVSDAFSEIFFGLIFNSNINFNVSNLVNLTSLSYLGVLMIIIGLLNYYLILDILISLSSYIVINLKEKLIFLAISFCLSFLYYVVITPFSVYFILVFALVILIGRLVYFPKAKQVIPAAIITSLIFSTIISVKLTHYEGIKELELRRRLALNLEVSEDPYALLSFKEVEENVVTDEVVKDFFRDPDKRITNINSTFSNLYLNGYLGKFDFTIHLYNTNDSLMNRGKGLPLQIFKKQVEEAAIKVSNYFYKLNNTFGIQNYFALFPIVDGNNKLGTIVLQLKAKDFDRFGAFPYVLHNGGIDQQSAENYYSYALYSKNRLVNHYGEYVYELSNSNFKGKVDDFAFQKEKGYEHLIYKPSAENLIVISKSESTFWKELASLSFIFVVFSLFAFLMISYRWFYNTFNYYELNLFNLKKSLAAANNRLLYKTRIQIALVLAVVSSLLIIGIITFSYISIQYKEQQTDLIKNKIQIITEAFENNISRKLQSLSGKNDNISFEEFSRMYDTDLNLFDKDGFLLYSTQYKIYAVGLIAERMNPLALVNLKLKEKSQFIQEENIKNLKYTSAYMPVMDNANRVIAYLQLPYFANQYDYNQKIGTFLNLLINIYVLVFVAIGFFAVVVANQITSPLSLIQENISKTAIGKKNNPIKWKRKDEIGNLISEYNAMIDKLDENANKLARSEKETAWREMAKQVAHEIKNPLTPLRLGIQMLDRAWREKDEKFDLKFKKFSASFLEQIDNLSHIASQFSNFAKMPELKLEHAKLVDIVANAIDSFEANDRTEINFDKTSLTPFILNVDVEQMQKILTNLIKNAVEAMPDDRDGKIKITADKDGNRIKLTIRDNGSGIPVDIRERIFLPNFTTKSSGTGLGLAFAKQAIQNMGGNIYFTTENNVGTSFYIDLPLVILKK